MNPVNHKKPTLGIFCQQNLDRVDNARRVFKPSELSAFGFVTQIEADRYVAENLGAYRARLANTRKFLQDLGIEGASMLKITFDKKDGKIHSINW